MDDFDPELWQWTEKKLFEAGALDVWRQNIAMKKGRMGICLSILCDCGQAEVIETVLFHETTAIGLRRHEVEKEALTRDLVKFEFEGATLQFKRVYLQGEPLKYKVEYDDLVRYAQESQLSILAAQNRLRVYLEADEKWKFL